MLKCFWISLLLVLPFSVLSQQSVLWKVVDTATQHTSYVYGTMHNVQLENVIWKTDWNDYLATADVLYFEIDVRQKIKFIQNDLWNCHPIIRHLDTLKTLIANCDTVASDLPLTAEGFLIAANQHLAQLDFGALESIKAVKKIKYQKLKAKDEKLGLYIPNKVSSSSLADLYLAQNIQGLTNALEQNLPPSYYKALFEDRNRAWMKKISKLISKKSVFFAVGAGHLGGQNGLLELLRQKGFVVTPVF